MKDGISEAVRELTPELIEWRRHLHRHPELSFQEEATTEYIAGLLDSFGVPCARPVKTGAVAALRGARPGRTIAFRADIDALPMTETADVPFRSQTPGVMHSCGHDGHAAMLLAAVRILSGMRDRLCGEVRFIFQPAEELPPGGAAQMVAAGVGEGVDAFYGLHLTSSLPTGKFWICPGAFSSATDRFDAVIRGKGGHSSMPQLCVDPVVAGAQFITALQTVVSRNVPAVQKAVVSACSVRAGDAYNIIPDEMTVSGSVRTFDPEVRKAIPEHIRRLLDGTCAAYGAAGELKYTLGYASVVNDPALTAQTRARICEWFGEDSVRDLGPEMFGEDFSAFVEHTPGFFADLGAGNAAKGATLPHHNPGYLMDEDALPIGAEYWVRLALDNHE